MALTEMQRAVLEDRGPENVRARLADAGPGDGAAVPGLGDGLMSRRDVEDWLNEKTQLLRAEVGTFGLRGVEARGQAGSLAAPVGGRPAAGTAPVSIAGIPITTHPDAASADLFTVVGGVSGAAGIGTATAVGRATTRVGKAVLQNRVPIETTAAAFLLLVQERIERLREEKPNSDDGIAARDASLLQPSHT